MNMIQMQSPASRKPGRSLALGVPGALVLTLVVNILANSLPINGLSTARVSAMFPSFFLPAGFTFSIWGLIYGLLTLFAASVAWALWFQDPDHLARLSKSLALPFILTCFLNSLWILAWHHLQLGMSLVIMLGLLCCLLYMYQVLQPFRTKLNALQYLNYYLPIVIYLAWISVATIANTSAWLVSIQWSWRFWEPITWGIVMMASATCIALAMLFTRREIPFALVVAWALIGIQANQRNAGSELVLTAKIGVGLLLILSIFMLGKQLISRLRSGKQE